MSEGSHDVTADARRIETEILRRLAVTRNDEVAKAVGRDASWVSKLVAADTGLRIEQLQPFLAAIGLKVVPIASVSVDPEVLGAYKVLAKQALNGGDAN